MSGQGNNLFDSIRDWYAEEEYDPKGQLLYRPPPLADFWIDEPGRQEQKEHLGKQRQHQERRIQEKNRPVPVPEQETIPHKTKDNTPPFVAPISNDKSSDCDSFVELPQEESEGDFFEDVTPEAPQSSLPPEAPNLDL